MCCPQCGGPLGETEVEVKEEFKPVTRIIRIPDGLDLKFGIDYADGSPPRIKVFSRDWLEYYGRSDLFNLQDKIMEELVREFDLDPFALDKIKFVDIAGLW